MLRRIARGVANLFRHGTVERDLTDEIGSYEEMLVQEHIAAGLTPAAARRKARLALGSPDDVKESVRDVRAGAVLEQLFRDIRYGARALGRSRGFTAVAVLTLALGIGANTAIFSVVNGVLLRPLPYQNPGQLVTVAYGRGSTVAPGVFLDWKDASHSFSRMGMEEYWTPNRTGNDRPEHLFGVRVSTEILPLLGISPLLGRWFVPDEGHSGSERVLLLSYSFWKTRFAGDSAVLGKTLTLDGEPYAIVGVMPPGFEFTPYWATGAMFAAPLALDLRREDRAGSSLRSFARLAPGVTLAQANSDMRAISARLEREYPGTNQNVRVAPLRDEVVGNIEQTLVILLGAVGFVLLIACANVAHLQLVRAASKHRELALRAALGASRGRLIRQSLIESGLLALGGSGLGLLLGYEGLRLFLALAPASIPRLGEVKIDAGVLGFTFLATLLAGAAFGIVPAIRVTRVPSSDVLKEGGRSVGESVRQRRTRGALVVSEFALALVLLVGAGLLLRSLAALLQVSPGFDTHNLLSLQVSVRGTASEPAELRVGFFHDLAERVRALPGVEATSAINHVPLNGDDWNFPFSLEGRPFPAPGHSPKATFLVAEPGYFKAMGIHLGRGREFTPEDQSTAAQVVVINSAMARRHWAAEDPIGKRITVDDPATHPEWFTVVGVADDVRQSSWTAIDQNQMYFPYILGTRRAERNESLLSFLYPDYMTLVVRTSEDPAGLTKAVEAVVHTLDRDAPVSAPLTMDQAIAQQFAAPRFYVFLIGSFAGVALLLAAIGIYGVISYSVARRSHEFGVRLALGAGPGRIVSMIVGQGVRLAAIGGGLGVIGALLLTRYVGTLLYRTPPTDPITIAAVAVLLGAVAVLACWIPARGALRVSPADALRSE